MSDARSLADVVAARDAAVFVGRERELAAVEELLRPDSPAVLLFVHGPGGMGKSSLLREVARRATRDGCVVRTVDGRELHADPESLDQACAPADRLLVLIDTLEQAPAIGRHLRRTLLPALPADARVVVAGRVPPDRGWAQDGWDTVVRVLALPPLSRAESTQLLDKRGVTDEHRVSDLVRWADGLALALVVGAEATGRGPGTSPPGIAADGEAVATLLRHLVGEEAQASDHDLLAVAAIAEAVDRDLIAAVLPGMEPDAAERRLRELTFTEPAGTRIALHESVRQALRADLRARDPEHERALRVRIAEHLYDRGAAGETRLGLEMRLLIDDPAVRWGAGAQPGGYRADRLRAGDLVAIDDRLGGAEWGPVRRWFTDAPRHVIVVRDADDILVGAGVWCTPGLAPAWVAEDAVSAAALAHASRVTPAGNALVLRAILDFGDRSAGMSPVAALGNPATVLACGLPNPRWLYVGADTADAEQSAFLDTMGYRSLGDAVADGPREVRVHVLDTGPGGLLAQFLDMVLRDVGRPGSTSGRPGGLLEQVRSALRAFHDPLVLAEHPLARGETTAERASSVRAALEESLAAAFDATPQQQSLRILLVRAYVDPTGGHTRAAAEQHLSRSTYFRRLTSATTQLAAHLSAGAP